MKIADIRRGYEAHTTSPPEVLEMFLWRIGRYNPMLNAVVTLNPTAVHDAQESAARWRRGEQLGPLDGVPFLAKDNLWTAGVRTTWGSELFSDFVPPHDEIAVATLRRAGAVLLGKTATPEFACLGASLNRKFGPTRNSWDPRLTAGGSSSGSASAMGAGLAAFTIGTDAGGSVRRPAVHNGVVGFKPTPGRISSGGGFPVWHGDLDMVGPMTQDLRDLDLVLQVMSQPDQRDPTSASFGAWHLPDAEATRELSVKLAVRMNDLPVDARAVASAQQAAAALRSAGHDVQLGSLEVDLAEIAGLLQTQVRRGLRQLASEHPGFFEQVEQHNAADAMAAQCEESAVWAGKVAQIATGYAAFREIVEDAFEGADVMMTPAAAAQPWSFDLVYPTSIDGRPAGPRDHACFTGWVNAGGLPAVTLPTGLDEAGIPIGVQIVGRPGRDHEVVALAMTLEKQVGFESRVAQARGHLLTRVVDSRT